MEWIKHVPTIIVILTLEVAGLVAIWGLFDSKFKKRAQEKDILEERIAELYRTEIEQLNRKIQAQDEKIKVMQSEVTRIGGENKIMRELLSGQDKDTKEWRARTEQSMELITEIAKLSMANGKKGDQILHNIEQIGKHIERLATAIEKSKK